MTPAGKKSSLTPLMRQFHAVKQQHPDKILFFRMGDFYEMFGDDAIKAAPILGISLTSRSHGEAERIPLAGVPHHSAEKYLARLLAAGEKVVIVEQVEDPKTAKGLVKRDIVEILTPGTATVEGIDTGDRLPSLAAIVEAKKGYLGLAVLELSTGVFIVDDLGRQAEPPQKIVNRWIVPLEESRDILALQSGEKFTVPFDTLVIFSTNFHPNEIFDKAALRRIFFKIKIDGPSQENFLKIFALVARKKGMELDEATLVHLLKQKYPTIDNVYANYQPVFLIDQMIAICDFEGIPYRMSPDLIDRAWANMFVKDEKIVK